MWLMICVLFMVGNDFSSHDLVDVAREVNRRRAVCRRFVK